MHGEINTGGFGNYPTGEWSVEPTEWTAILGDKKKNTHKDFNYFGILSALDNVLFFLIQPTDWQV